MRAAIVLTTTLALAASGSAAPAQAQTYSHYECADGAQFEVAFYPETKFAFLQLDGKSLQLPKRLWPTGQRFSKSGVVLSLKSGGNATIKRHGKTSQCKVK
jgi:hypothetical protein